MINFETNGRNSYVYCTMNLQAMSMDDPTTGKMTPLDITKADSADENWEGDMIVKVDKPDNFIQENYPVFMLYYK